MQHLPSTIREVADGTLTELLSKLDADELRRGKQFEKIVKWWLQNDAARSRNLKTVWLWDEWPDRPGRDIGVDLVAEMLDGSLCAIQAKCFSSDRDIPKSEIDSFISAASPRTFAQRWLVATTNGLSANARRTIHDNQVTFVPLAELDAAVVTWPSKPDSLEAVKKPGKAKPRPHQQRAIRDVLKGLEANSRGQMIMACGTGKTLTALWITERLDANTTLVLVPSLNLLSQTLTEWAHNTQRDWSYICVCSDDTVNKEDDQPINTTVDLPYPVTTKPSEIAHFLKSKGRKIVFSTYQSSAQVAKAQKLSGKKFDLTICDEAHRLTGKTDADYATVLDEKKIISKKRLFMTATPRTYTANVKAKAEERGVEITSMDDPHIYGHQFHKLTFGEAIKQKLLTDYQVVIVGVTDPQVQDLIDRRELVSVNDAVKTDARTLAAHIGLAKATKEFNLSKTITFHSRIQSAAQFSIEHPKILAWLPATHKPQGTTWSGTISGEMNTGKRRALLQQLRKDLPGRHALLTNARCLTEGIDVPALDGVGFIDPRSSRVDIIQAVGRAIRKSQNKKLGTIVLPVLLSADVNQQELLDSSSFKPIWEILNALKSHDSELGEELDQLRTELGRTSRIGVKPPKIRVDIPRNIELTYPHFQEHLILAIVERTTTSWEWWFGLAQAFTKEFKDISIIGERKYKGHDLGGWAEKQRANFHSGTLDKVRTKRLQSLRGWSWDPLEDQWNSYYEELKSFAKKHGHALVPDAYQQKGIQLGKWIGKQRIAHKRGRLPKDKIKKLQDVKGWSWDPLEDQWNSNYEELKSFAKKQGHVRVPYGTGLFRWIVTQRQAYTGKRGRLPMDKVKKLEDVKGWSWDPLEDQWNAMLQGLKTYAQKHGNTRVPESLRVDGRQLSTWVESQRIAHKRGRLPKDKIKKLQDVKGWSWNPIEDQWNSNYEELKSVAKKHGHALVPDAYRQNGIQLGKWIGKQRIAHKRGRLPKDKVKKLEDVKGWSWDPLEDQWNSNYEELKSFAKKHGHALVPDAYRQNGIQLGKWIGKQRIAHKHGRLPKDKVKKLEDVKGWSWDGRIRSRTKSVPKGRRNQ